MLELQHLGERIREIRKERMMTIKTLSEYTGLSVGYLSTLEQCKTMPSIDTLALICEVLETSIAEIIDVKQREQILIRREERKLDQYPKENMTIARIEFQSNGFLYEYITIRPGKCEQVQEYRHLYDEVCTVISGEISVKVRDEIYRLYPGDSLLVKNGERHSIFNEGKEESVSFWVYQRK